MASDFHVIEDLTSQVPHSGPASPAHFDWKQREQELKRWKRAGIVALSYATLSNSPFRFASDDQAPVWDLANPCTYPEIAKDSRMSAGTDVFYRLCYRACAGGPLERPDGGGKVSRRLNGAPREPLKVWDNDGIVNTLSMLWPNVENVLVTADHLDIVGHYQLVPIDPKRAGCDCKASRRYRSYDLLKSVPQFRYATFEQVWTEIFKFSVGI